MYIWKKESCLKKKTVNLCTRIFVIIENNKKMYTYVTLEKTCNKICKVGSWNLTVKYPRWLNNNVLWLIDVYSTIINNVVLTSPKVNK